MKKDEKMRIAELHKQFVELEFNKSIPEEIINNIWELWLDEDFDDYWYEEMETTYIHKLDFYLDDNSEFGEDFLNTLQKYIHSDMVNRAEDYGDEYVYPTLSWGDYHNLIEISKSSLNIDDQKMALLNILYRFHYWCWQYVEKGKLRIQQKKWFDDIIDIIEY